MTARCAQCGHENNPEYRFCGICGAPLQPLITTREAGPARPPARVSGPSFLGLGDDRSRDLDYLLEDEPPRTHRRLYLALVLLIASAALLVWHWRRDGYPWTALIRPAANRPPVSSGTAPAPPPPSAPETNAQPAANVAPSAPQSAAVTEKAEAASPAAAEPANSGTTPSSAAPPNEPVGGSAATPNPAAAPATTSKPPDQISQATEPESPAKSSAPPSTAPATAPAEEPETEASVSKQAPATEEAIPKQPASKPTASRTPISKPSAALPAVSPDDRLVAEGENYLYGRGVRADCALAQRNLLIGAQHSNAKAQTLLGAMYATGHCVIRDLPTAYRWFAKALQGDPSNSRVQRDLEVLWKQMTPEERQIAMRSR